MSVGVGAVFGTVWATLPQDVLPVILLALAPEWNVVGLEILRLSPPFRTQSGHSQFLGQLHEPPCPLTDTGRSWVLGQLPRMYFLFGLYMAASRAAMM